MNLKLQILFVCIALLTMAALHGCGPAAESTKTETTPPISLAKEAMFERGRQLYFQQSLDSAQTMLNQAIAIDANYREPIEILAPLHYDLAMRSDGQKKKAEQLRKSRDYYVKLESFGSKDSELYERICEIANMMNDDKTFVKYAKKNADAYPFDRQYYNLSVAYANVEDWNTLIATMKKAVDKFKDSPYIGSFYRQLGRAYTKVDRDQTAEKVFYSGLSSIDGKIAELRKGSDEYRSSPEFARLNDDKIGILISLKNLHTTYKAMDKLAQVERKLKELGR